MSKTKSMFKVGRAIAKFIDDNIESVSLVNNGGIPQIVLTPKGTAKEIIDAVQKGNQNGKEASQEEGK